ncbi:MAG: response regulator [Ktedonobacterales bacterium]
MSGANADAERGRTGAGNAGDGEPEGQQRVSQAPASTEAQPDPLQPPLVLIAEDEEPIAEAIALIVEDAGYTPLVAAHGKQALELARLRHPALVITDLMMPQMDGTQLIANLRADAEANGHAPPPIILMTAAGMKRAQEADANALLRKPFELDELEELLFRFLGPPPLSTS